MSVVRSLRVVSIVLAVVVTVGLGVRLSSEQIRHEASGVVTPSRGTGEYLSSPGPAPVVRGVAEWQRRFDEVAAEEDATIYGPASRSDDSWDHYNLAFGLDGFLAMYRATSDRRYLLTALGYAENLVAGARPSSELGPGAVGDDYLGWISERPDVAGTEVPLFESFVWRYVADLLRVMRNDTATWEDPDLRVRYQRVLDFAERNIVEKWVTRSLDDAVYRERTHMASHWAAISVDLAAITTDPERRKRYEGIVAAIDRDLPNRGSSLRQQLVPNPANRSAWFWSDVWGSQEPPGQDVAHGNGVVSYVVTAHEMGSEWTTEDIAGFSALLRTEIWRPEGGFSEYVDGADANGNGWISDGFMKLGRFDPWIQQRLETYDGATPDNRGGNVQFLGNGALNARFLTEPFSVAGVPPGRVAK